MITLTINDKKIKVKPRTTILQACSLLGIEIPKFCYHEKLSIAGNCRMCLVEVKGQVKPIASCAMEVSNDMVVYTNTSFVKKAREGVLEFLLANHPLDCPICDQGGECDLQDLTLIYGNDRSRFNEKKTTVKEKNLGPLVKTVMTRCIHCTRCIRFGKDIAGIPDLGTTGRGNKMEISTYIETLLNSEISGNIIDLCPVGALTSKPSAFTSRVWEQNKIDGVDIFDGIGSNISIHVRGLDIIRILPKVNEDINQEWISDKVRFSYDAIKYQRINEPMYREKLDENFKPISWLKTFELIKHKVSNANNIQALYGGTVNLETLAVFKDLFTNLNATKIQSGEHTLNIDNDFRSNYIYNDSLVNIKHNDLCILLGTDTKLEAPTFNIRLVELVNKNSLKVLRIGQYKNPQYTENHIGQTMSTLIDISEGRHSAAQHISKSENPTLIVSSSLFKNKNDFNLLKILYNNIKKYNNNFTLNILHPNSSNVSALDLNAIKNNSNEIKNNYDFTYLLDVHKKYNRISKDEFIVYQGSNVSENTKKSNLILPSLTYLEQTGTYVNTEGKVQVSNKAINNLLNNKETWLVLLGISNYLKIYLNYYNRKELVKRIEMVSPTSLVKNKILSNINLVSVINNKENNNVTINDNKLLNNYIVDFYKTDNLTSISPTMNECSNKFNY